MIVSERLFKNKLILDYFRKNGTPGMCSYTNVYSSHTVTLSDLVGKIRSIISNYYGDADDEGVAFDSSFDDDEYNDASILVSRNNGYILPKDRRMFDNIEDLLYHHAFICKNDKLFEDIIDLIGNVNLVEKDPYGTPKDEEFYMDWTHISKESIKLARAGCNLSIIQSKLNSSLFYILSAIQQEHKDFIVYKKVTLFRCVNYNNPLKIVSFSDLTSPPVCKTADLRMSVKGDSVFYGSFDKNTAIREALTADNKCYTYVGEFESHNELNLLDLTKITKKIDIFDTHKTDYFILRFLKKFCDDISKPIKGNPIEYTPTQLVTYYFRNCMKRYDEKGNKHDLDGILYSSSKGGSANAVLFFNHNDSGKHLKLLSHSCINP